MNKEIVFFGTSDFGIPCLEGLVNSDEFEIKAVITQPDKPVGRKQILEPSPIKKRSLELNLPVFDAVDALDDIEVDLAVLISYGEILKPSTIAKFSSGIINVHPSMLPQWRGPAPIQYALLNDDKITGVSIMMIDSGMDTGPILSQTQFPIDKSDDYITLSKKLSLVSVDLLLDAMKNYVAGSIQVAAQKQSGITYSKIISKSDGQIKSTDDPYEIINKLRAYAHWPGIFFIWKNQRIKLLTAHIENDEFMIDSLQPAGKKPMSYQDFLHGHPEFLFSDVI
ncbi:MAG: methionyl-tRNA formyltransferase [bacterium]|nr:methionyl-tRNA formyltransferase [bacterium]